MRITVYTSNQPRHVAFIHRLTEVADVTAIIEPMPYAVGTNYHESYQSPTMREYFQRVLEAESKVFGGRTGIEGAKVLAVPMGEASSMFIEADRHLVFGASYLKAPAISRLIGRKAVNIHMGISPEYRGSSCNFWAMYDRRPDLVGSTVHLLSEGLDSGPILFHTKSKPCSDPFEYTMRAVDEVQKAVVDWFVWDGDTSRAVPQDKSKEIRYTKAADFTDEIAREFLDRGIKCSS